MANVLLIIGIILIVGSFLFRPKKSNQYQPLSIEAFQEDFFEQFKMSQSKLQSLYAFDFSEVCSKLDEIEGRLDQLVQQLSEPSNLDEKTSKKIVEYLELKNQGKSLDEIVKILQMEKGELLFLENLSKSITNS